MANSLQKIFFSPTQTTKKILDAVGEGINLPIHSSLDLTMASNRNFLEYTPDADIILIGVPVYGSNIPPIVLENIKSLKGNGKFAIPIVVYGNVKAGRCWEILATILQTNGFLIIGGGRFIGEHSFTNKLLPLALGRPDEKDLNEARLLGKELAKKIGSEKGDLLQTMNFESATELEINPIHDPKKSKSTILPEVNKEICIDCKKCVFACPSSAIDENSLKITENKCIQCFACARVCPEGARQISLNMSPERFDKFFSFTKTRKEPEFIL